jgi:hypothetical protein
MYKSSIKSIEEYQKEFISETTPSQNFRSQAGSVFQWRNKEDERIREDIKKYSIEINSQQNIGFDGKIFYSYKIEGDPNTTFNNPKKNDKYKVIVTIENMGSEEDLSKESELEKFLKEKGFEKIKENN